MFEIRNIYTHNIKNEVENVLEGPWANLGRQKDNPETTTDVPCEVAKEELIAARMLLDLYDSNRNSLPRNTEKAATDLA